MATKAPEIFYIGIIRRKDMSTAGNSTTLVLSKEFWTESFGRFTANGYKQAMTFTAQTVAERTRPGERLQVEEGGGQCYSLGTSVGVAAIIITNAQYPFLVVQGLLSKVVDEWTASHPRDSYKDSIKSPNRDEDPVPWTPLKKYISEWQKPEHVDSITKAQAELDETKVILHKTIESVLERGEKLDNLVAKSEGLSASSKVFYQHAKKQNSCCVVM